MSSIRSSGPSTRSVDDEANKQRRTRQNANEEYAWERTFERTWESVQEDESGLLRTDHLSSLSRRRQQRYYDENEMEYEGGNDMNGNTLFLSLSHTRIQRGMLRNLFIILDLSQSMIINDLKPNRAAAVAKVLHDFIHEYFDSNPVSQLGIIVSHHATAEKLTDLSGNPRRHMAKAAEAVEKSNSIGGELSIQTSLDIAVRTLILQPDYGTREILFIHGAHSTRDPGAIKNTISMLKEKRVRVSFISLPGEVYLPSKIAKETGGTYHVPETVEDLRAQVMLQCRPPPRRMDDPNQANITVKMVRVGFPELVQETEGLCTCHQTLQSKAHICPVCSSRCCDIPTECMVCHLQLVSAPNLARSYHHLFPVPLYIEIPSVYEPGTFVEKAVPGSSTAATATTTLSSASQDTNDNVRMIDTESSTTIASSKPVPSKSAPNIAYIHDTSTYCTACLIPLPSLTVRYKCPDCLSAFCFDCDQLIHETIHNCPGCVN